MSLRWAGPPGADPPGADPPGAGLRWAVKESFVRYVRVIAAGTCAVSGGAVLGADDVIEFPLLTASSSGDGWDLGFGGRAHFLAHHGALDVGLTGLRLTLGPSGGGLSVDGLTIASLPPAAPVERDKSLVWEGVVPSLTDAGVPLFGNVYAAGTALAALDAAVPLNS